MKKRFIFIFVLLLMFVSSVSAQEISHKDIPEDAVVIGTHLYSREYEYTNSGVYRGSITSQVVMMGSSSLDTSSYSSNNDFIIYRKVFNENPDNPIEEPEEWINSLTGQDIPLSQIPDAFTIYYINGTCVEAGGCSQPGGSGGGGDPTIQHSVTFRNVYGLSPRERAYPANDGGLLSANYKPDTPVRYGYTFKGWFEEDGHQFAFNQPITRDYVLHDEWTAIDYRINFDLDGGSTAGGMDTYASRTCNLDVADSCKIPEEEPIKSGYNFRGWKVKDNTSNKILTNGNDIGPFLSFDTNITLIAVWEEVRYDVTWELDGGSFTSQNYNSVTRYITNSNRTVNLVQPVRTGYTFTGWKYNGTTIASYRPTYTITELGAATFTATWQVNTYTVTYKNLPSGVTISPTECTYGQQCNITTTIPEKPGSTFVEWREIDRSNVETGFAYGSNADIKNITRNISVIPYYGNSTNMYNINYHLDIGSYFTASPVTYYYYGQAQTLPSPRKDGYRFVRWTNRESCAGQSVSISNTTTGNIDAYPCWEATRFKVYYQKQGENLTNPQDCTFGESCMIDVRVNPEDNSGDFSYWDDLNGHFYLNERDVNITPIIDSEDGSAVDIYLNARFDTSKTYNINYNLAGGTNPDNAINKYETGVGANLPIPTKANYKFGGWKLGNENIGTVLPSTATGNKTLTATWNSISVTVNVDLNYDNAPAVPARSCTLNNYNCSFPDDPTRMGYTFLGWSLTDGADKFITTNTDLTKFINGTNSLTIHAIWAPVNHSVIYELGGGQFESSVLVNNPYTFIMSSDTVNLTTAEPKKTGYDFGGWKVNGHDINVTNVTDVKIVQADLTNSPDVVLTAKWNPISVTLKYSFNGRILEHTDPGNYDGARITIEDPVYTGHSFLGWELNGYVYHKNSIVQGYTNEVTLTATFNDGDQYSISYDLNEGDGYYNNLEPIGSYFPQVGTNLPIPVKENYKFAGWQIRGDSAVIYRIAQGSTGNYDLVAQWDKIDHTVRVLNGSNVITEQVTHGDSYTLPAAPDAPDAYHQFAGWLNVNTNSLIPASQNDTINGDYTYVPKWDITSTFFISYDLNGGYYGTNHPSSFTLDDVRLVVDKPTKAQHRFDRFVSSVADNTVNCTGDSCSVTIRDHRSFTLTAEWTRTTYNITYDYAGGSANNEATYEVTNPNTNLSINVNTPTREGYRFDGWTIDAGDATSTQSNDYLTIGLSKAVDVKLTAKWIKDSYSIVYDYNQSDTTPPNLTTYVPSETSSIQLIRPAKAGYTFAEWHATCADGSDEGIGLNVDTLNITTPCDIVVSVEWIRVQYNINYNLDGGSYSGTLPQNYTYATGVTVDIPTPTKANYRFDKWIVTPEDAATYENGVLTINSRADISLTASWIYNVYSISYEMNGGTATGNPESYVFNPGNQGMIISFNHPTKTGSTFERWTFACADGNLTVDALDDITKIHVTEPCNITATAHFAQDVYDIYYDLVDGQVNGTNPVDYDKNNYGDLTIIPPMREHYTFAGWDVAENATVDEDGKLHVTEASDLHLTARWTPKTYQLTFDLDDDQTVPCVYGTACDISSIAYPEQSDGAKVLYWVSDQGTTYRRTDDVYAFADMTLTPYVETPTTYNIIYHLNGGDFNSNVINSYVAGKHVTLPGADVIEKPGYVFSKWTSEAACQGSEIESIPSLNGDTDVYACYDALIFTAKYYNDETGNEVMLEEVDLPYNAPYDVKQYSGSVLGKTFAYWLVNGRAYLPGQTLDAYSEVVEFRPVFIPAIANSSIHTITYNLNGGDILTGELVGKYVEGDTFTLGTVYKEGSTFTGWSTDQDGNNMISSVANQNTDLVLYAQWTVDSYTLRVFEDDDATTPVREMSVNYGDKIKFIHGPNVDADETITEGNATYIYLRYDKVQVNPNTNQNEYLLASGWKTYNGDTQYPYDYDFGKIVTSNPNVNIVPVIDENDEFVNLADKSYVYDQEHNLHVTGAGVGSTKVLNGQIYLDDLVNNEYYGKEPFDYPLEQNAVLNADNFALTSINNPNYPQVKYTGTLFSLAKQSIEITNYTVQFDISENPRSFECEYNVACDLSNIDPPQKDGFTFVGWKASVDGVEYAEQFVYTNLAETFIKFTPVFAANRFTVSFNDLNGDEIKSIEVTYGQEKYEVVKVPSEVELQGNRAASSLASAINTVNGKNTKTRDSDNTFYYLPVGWTTVENGTDVEYSYHANFGELVTERPHVQLYPVIDLNRDFVGISITNVGVNQDGIKTGSNAGGLAGILYGDTLTEYELGTSNGSQFYFDDDFTRPVDLTKALTSDDWELVYNEEYDPHFPQDKWHVNIYSKMVLQTVPEYTINFYDTDLTTIKKSVDLTYGGDSYYAFDGTGNAGEHFISGWTLEDRITENTVPLHDYLFDFSHFAAMDSNVNLYPVTVPGDKFVVFNVDVKYFDQFGAVIPMGATEHYTQRYGTNFNLDILNFALNKQNRRVEFYLDSEYTIPITNNTMILDGQIEMTQRQNTGTDYDVYDSNIYVKYYEDVNYSNSTVLFKDMDITFASGSGVLFDDASGLMNSYIPLQYGTLVDKDELDTYIKNNIMGENFNFGGFTINSSDYNFEYYLDSDFTNEFNFMLPLDFENYNLQTAQDGDGADFTLKLYVKAIINDACDFYPTISRFADEVQVSFDSSLMDESHYVNLMEVTYPGASEPDTFEYQYGVNISEIIKYVEGMTIRIHCTGEHDPWEFVIIDHLS